MDANSLVELLGALGAVGGVIFGAYKYLTGRDRQMAIRDAFQNVISDLSSSSDVKRQAAAILLRRFMDPQTELGQAGTPYAGEAISVIAAILRTEKTGEFQKLLADGLRSAPSLEGADLQRTNLQNAYLGPRGNVRPNLRGADFYRADLSSASLKGAMASRAVFYQACLHNTTLRDADLSRANFFEADLLGANFNNAILTDADLGGARNVPEDLRQHVGANGKYAGPKPYKAASVASAGKSPQVFLSKPGVLSAAQATLVSELTRLLAAEAIGVATLERSAYSGFGGGAQVRRVLSGCSGAIVLGFRQLEVASGQWRSGTEEAAAVEGIALPTAWNHIEAGMATMAGLPLLCIREEGVSGGLFAFEDIDNTALTVDLDRLNLVELRDKLADWVHAVREAAG